MSEQTESNERKLSGTTRLFTGFVIGALFALAPMYYFYMGREAALNDGAAPDTRFAAPAPPVEARSAGAAGTPPFASRMTYELSRLPEEPLPVVARAPIAPVAPEAAAPAAAVPRPADSPRETRVADARPISTRPPAPRDRTAAIEEEAQKLEYREAPRDEAAPRRPKVFEGREIEVSSRRLPATATKPITAEGTPDVRVGQAGPPVAGVSPITGPPEKSPAAGADSDARDVAAASTAAAKTAASATVDERLAATREWLNVAAKSTHTIQLMGTRSEAQLDAQLKSLGQLLEPNRLYVYRTIAQGKPSITVVYGEYADRKSALLALDKLPPALVANKPVLRTVSGIRAEMKQHKTDG